jgi:hypothetical protein
VQKIDVSQPEFGDDMTSAEILAKVAQKPGMQAAWYMAMAFELDPAEYGIEIEGETVAEGIKAIKRIGEKTVKCAVSASTANLSGPRANA